MKSRGRFVAALKARIVFSLIDFILLSDDCNMFIPLPLCPITTNFGNLKLPVTSSPSPLTPKQEKLNKALAYKTKIYIYICPYIKIKIDSRDETYHYESGLRRSLMWHYQGLDQDWEHQKHEQLWEPFMICILLNCLRKRRIIRMNQAERTTGFSSLARRWYRRVVLRKRLESFSIVWNKGIFH